MSLFLVSIDDDYSPRLQEIDLVAVHEAIIAKIPKFYERPGGYAPVTYIDWPNIRWITPSKCELHFFDKNMGLDSEAKFQVEIEAERPKVTILSIKDKIEEQKKETIKP